MPSIGSLQRQYVINGFNIYTRSVEYWRWKREQLPASRIPWDYPRREALNAAGYIGREDLLGATALEVSRVTGLSIRDAEAVFTELGVGMGFFRNGVYVDAREITVLDAVELDSDYESDSVFLGDRNTARLTLTVEDFEGLGFRVEIQTRRDSDDEWSLVDVFNRVAGNIAIRSRFSPLDREIRAKITFEDSETSATISVVGEAT